VVGKTGVARAVKRLDEGWLKDQPDALLSSRIILGMFYIQENDGAAAEKQFDAVIALSRRPDGTIPADISGVIHSGRGMALWMKKNLPEAEHELRAAIDDYRSVPGMGAKVAQLLFGLSAVRQAQGDGDEAQKLLAEATHIAASEPTMRGYVAGSNLDRDDWPAPEPTNLLKAGKFVEARKAFETAVQSDAANHWNWYYLSCLDLYLGDVPAYQDAARQMLQHFGGTAVNTIAERTAKVCLLTPQPVGELKKLLQLTQAAMSSDPKDDTYPWFALSNALAAYRAGEYEAALTSLDKSTSLKPPAARATIELLHAMISHQLKQPDQASHFLQAAITCIDSEMAKPGAVPLNSPENWLICHILRREAEQLITGKFTATSATQPRK
jgi:tetratricopeptide (TPR) repeat protein